MRNRLAKIFGLFLVTLIIFTIISLRVQEGHSASCPSVQISSLSPLKPATIPGAKRTETYLNGVWQFIPATTSRDQPPREGWGSIQVPGDWQHENNDSIPGIMERGTGKAWENFNGSQLAKAWYQRTLEIPQITAGQALLLDLRRVSTDAAVYVNGVKCGEVEWPYGAVDITRVVKPGTEATLSLLVVAAKKEAEKKVFMGPNEVYTTKAQLSSRGLIGEVRLLTMPQGARISDVFVQPSTRTQQIKLDVELTNVTQAGSVQLTAKMLDEQGNVERQFTHTAKVQAKPTQLIQLSWDWPNPRLWDVGQPNLYTLQLKVKGSSVDDEYLQPFGFREFWIEGRKFYLNGTEIRFRPVLHEDDYNWAGGVTEVADRMIDSYFWAGFNLAELWPWNHYERGTLHFRDLFAERADLKGFPIIAPALDVGHVIGAGKWKNREARERWEQQMDTELRRYRNHPSILLWATTPNFWGHVDDQNPLRIGKQRVEGNLGENDRGWRDGAVMGEEAVDIIRKHDPTRPVMGHSGGPIGDVYAPNNYLNLIPLQEREEWLSEWARSGDMPYMAVEFGTPLNATMMRGRQGFMSAVTSEPLMTEYTAIYLGKQAYALETPAYRQKIREMFVKNQEYHSWQNKPELNFSPAFQQLQQLFSTQTWRSWRTFGVSGGMIPWSRGHGWERSEAGKDQVKIGEFEPGRRGVYLKQVPEDLWYVFQPEAFTIHPSGKAIQKNNRSTLAWIAGSATAFTAKDHSFTAGEKLQKQVVLINDTRKTQEFQFSWEVRLGGTADFSCEVPGVSQDEGDKGDKGEVTSVNLLFSADSRCGENSGGKQLSKGEQQGKIKTSETLFFPVEVELPTVRSTAEGEIRLTAKIANQQHEDRFSFRVFEPFSPVSGTVVAFDPLGTTTQMLRQLGYTVIPWNSAENESRNKGREPSSAESLLTPHSPLSTSNLSLLTPNVSLLTSNSSLLTLPPSVLSLQPSVLVIGREALSTGNPLPAELENFIREGGRAIVFAQKPEWMQSVIGWRVSPQLSRRVFPLDRTHPIVKGFDEQDLRDWTGESTLVAAYPNTLNGGVKLSPHGEPWYGWHWGNRGVVSSAAIEKPHYGSWRPILESEFDLAYTPLTELDYGKGRLIWNTLDLEDHVPKDPAVTRLARAILNYAETAPLSPKADKVILIGDDSDAAKLDALGVIYQRSDSLKKDAQLSIIGARAKVKDEDLQSYLNQGGQVFFTPRNSPSHALGVKLHEVKNFTGSLSVPTWSETRGLSASDLRARTEYRTWLIQSGGEVGADGLLTRIPYGQGVAIFSQIDPERFNADVNTYFRLSRWRATRAMSQLLANLGASFRVDRQVFQLGSPTRNLKDQSTPHNNFYHSDYRTDFDLGDDPYRYHRW